MLDSKVGMKPKVECPKFYVMDSDTFSSFFFRLKREVTNIT